MQRQIRNWYRVVLPADAAIVVFFLLWGISYALFTIAVSLGATAWETHSGLTATYLYVVATIYAIFRAVYFNPVENSTYGRWLIDSPWRYPDRLPLGPLHLVWQDVVLVGLFVILFPRSDYDVLRLTTSFLLAYSLCITATLGRVGIYWPVYMNVALFGVFLLAVFDSTFLLLVTLAMYCAAFIGQRQMLSAFPFSPEVRERLRLGSQRQETNVPAGWPVPPNLRERYSWRISQWNAAGVSSAVAWLSYCALHHFRHQSDMVEPAIGLYLYLAIGFIGGRLWVYLWGYLPPISLLGRLFTGRLVQPRFDYVYVAPLAATVAAIAIPWLAKHLEVPFGCAYPIASGVVVWLCLALPPRREDWIYTGGHRISYQFIAKQEEAIANRRKSRSFRLSR
jgi:hypothetical protein